MHLLQGKRLIPEVLVIAEPSGAASAVIPENKDLVIRRIVLLTEGKEGGQRFPAAHAGLRLRINQFKILSAIDETADFFGTDSVMPLFRAAGLKNNRDVFRKTGPEQLRDIVGSGAVFRFEVAAADVPVNSPGIRGKRVNGEGQTEQEAGKKKSYHGILPEGTGTGIRTAGVVPAEKAGGK